MSTPRGVMLTLCLQLEVLTDIAALNLSNGVALSFHGKRSALEIGRKVRPRVMRRDSRLHVGPPVEQVRNLLIEGENLQAMVTLYKYRGQIDLILTDPPYNTGQQFRYNDAWDKDLTTRTSARSLRETTVRATPSGSRP